MVKNVNILFSMTIQKALFIAAEKLKKVCHTKREAYSQAESLLLHTLKTTRENLYIINRNVFPVSKYKVFNNMVGDRLRHMPLQYITGKAWFYGREFAVKRGVLIPRPDTEAVIEAFVRFIPVSNGMTIGELGAGSGIIPVTLALERPEIKRIYSYDTNIKAIRLSNTNATALQTKNKTLFIKGDFFKKTQNIRFDVIVSNPPYISAAQMRKLPKEVLKEPSGALRGGKTGISYYQKFYKYAKILLKDNGYCIFEAGDGMGIKIKKLFSGTSWHFVALVNDCRGLERAYVFQYLGEK